jgi:hypothetical protein
MLKFSNNKVISNTLKYLPSTLRNFNQTSFYKINSEKFMNNYKSNNQFSTNIFYNKNLNKNDFYNTQNFHFSSNQINQEVLKSLLNQVKTEEGKSILDLDLLYDIKFDPASGKTKILLNLHKDFRKIKILLENKIKATPELSNEKIEIAIAPQEKKSEPHNFKKSWS